MNKEITETIYEDVYNHLQNKMKKDSSFRSEIDELLFFYGRKLMTFVINDEQENIKNRELEDVVTSQFFQGYYVMKMILKDDDINFESEWTLGLGLVRNELPRFFESIFEKENVDWTFTKIGHKFSVDVLEVMEQGFDITKQIREDMANYGAYKAFIEDDRYIGSDNDTPSSMLLGNPFDLEFISPQVYMQAEFSTAENEMWDLYTWSAVQNGGWRGSVHLSRMTTIEQTFYVLELKMLNLITQEEKMAILDNIIKKIPSEIRVLLQIRLYHVDDIEIIISDNKD